MVILMVILVVIVVVVVVTAFVVVVGRLFIVVMFCVCVFRELAHQIAEQFRVLGNPIGLRDLVITGGRGVSSLISCYFMLGIIYVFMSFYCHRCCQSCIIWLRLNLSMLILSCGLLSCLVMILYS